MSQVFPITTATLPSPPPPRKGRPLVAWAVILITVVFIFWRSGKDNPADKEKYDLVTATLEGRCFVGIEQMQQRFSPGQSDKDALYLQARQSLDQHTYAQRLRFVVLAGELKGPDEARDQLRRLNERYHEHCGEPSAEDTRTAQLLDRLYALRERTPSALAALPEQDREELHQRLGWFGELALMPPGDSDPAARAAVLAPAYRTLVTLIVVGVVMVGLGLIGIVLLVTFFVLWFLHRLSDGLTPGSPHGGIYAETFALYMVLFLGLSFAGHYAVAWVRLENSTIALSGVAALASLAALAWPVLRGVSWRQVRHDIGWMTGGRLWLEVLFGVGGYAIALAMLPLAVILMMILTKLRDLLGWGPVEFGPSNAPGHPIVFSAAHAAWWVWLEVLFVASVVAPLVEETMFRGVLYRHLREASSRLHPAMSVVVSALAVSFVFAVIHPQGILAVPALMTLALAFALMREWRVTLVPSMIAHGINNAVATALLFFTMS